eukprot:TRINITY_DN3969_c0_g1_i1.p2 TRINITY_DN3969_c0_g1~~TRINITY_DN3969_c0_g1_i1.p2  ORF type:complete len:83 (-),score=9.44 TRINITY_DN3969_c0_g1_i1:153-401(-)
MCCHTDCDASLVRKPDDVTSPVFEKDDVLYCETHYGSVADRCCGCDNVLSGEIQCVKGQKWHPSCFDLPLSPHSRSAGRNGH